MPSEASPALDDLPNTLYGPINQNTLNNVMFYHSLKSLNLFPVSVLSNTGVSSTSVC